EDGRPNHQVIRFQAMPPSSAHRMTWEEASTTSVLMMPVAMVAATAVPISAPTRFITAASETAAPGESTLVATTVAIELAVSWKPLMNSNTSAVRITTITRVSMASLPSQGRGRRCRPLPRSWRRNRPGRASSRIRKHDLVGDHAGLAAAVDGLFQDLEEFLEQEHLQVVQAPGVDVAVQLQHQPVGLVLDRTQPLVERGHL